MLPGSILPILLIALSEQIDGFDSQDPEEVHDAREVKRLGEGVYPNSMVGRGELGDVEICVASCVGLETSKLAHA